MSVTLSILVCTLASRRAWMERLESMLRPQIAGRDDVELLVHEDDGQVSIGQKRNELLADANGLYVAFIDDDDVVPDDYVSTILDVARGRPDGIGFWVDRTVNGTPDRRAKHSMTCGQYGQGVDAAGKPIYLRVLNHLNPVRRDLALKVGFEPVNRGEDTDFALRLRAHVTSEVFIDRTMYLYEFRTADHRVGERVHPK